MGKRRLHRTWQCHCGIKYSVLARDPNIAILPDRFKCWSPVGCRYYLKRNDLLSAGTVVQAQAIYQIISGMGTEVERRCAPEDVLKLMVGSFIKSVALAPAPDPRRSLIASITLDGGRTIHLATSTRGVTIYKVTNG